MDFNIAPGIPEKVYHLNKEINFYSIISPKEIAELIVNKLK